MRLPPGRRPHGFLHTRPDGRRVEVEEFQAVNPDAGLTLALGNDRAPFPLDLLVCLHPVVDPRRSVLELERYDHLVTGWCRRYRRYREQGPPLVIFVCPDDASASALCQLADGVVTACWSYAGQPPARWAYVGRDRMLFAAEGDVHHDRTWAYAMPALPPHLRLAQEETARRQNAAVRREIVAPELLQSPPASPQLAPAPAQSRPAAG